MNGFTLCIRDRTVSLKQSYLDNILIGQGSKILEAEIKNSVIGRNVHIEKGASIEDSVILDGNIIGAKARIKRTIIDRFNVIKPGTSIGFNNLLDQKTYHVTRSGLVVLSRGQSVGGYPIPLSLP